MALIIERPTRLCPYTTFRFGFGEQQPEAYSRSQTVLEIRRLGWRDWIITLYCPYSQGLDFYFGLQLKWRGCTFVKVEIGLSNHRTLQAGLGFHAPGAWTIGFWPIEPIWYIDD